MKMTIIELRGVLQALSQNKSYREIHKQHGTPKTTIGRIVSRFVDLNLTFKEIEALSDEQCISLFFPSETKRFFEPDWFDIHKMMGQAKFTLSLAYSEYEKNVCEHRRYSYASFCRRYRDWQNENGIASNNSGNIEYAPGERMEVDFVGDDLQWVDSDGEIRKSRLFVATLPYSKLFFTEAFEDETQQSWIKGIVDALEYFGGVPQVLVVDNAKALVRHADWHEGDIQPAIHSLCRYYNMQPWACKPATPKQKNRVEAAACDVERWIIAKMTSKQLPLAYDLDDLNEKVRIKLDEANEIPFRLSRFKKSRRSQFEEEEKSELSPLPQQPYEHGQWKLLVADKAHCIRLSSDFGHRYSVPSQYTGKKVCVRICQEKIEIYNPSSLELLGTHKRVRTTRGSKTHILEEHLTSAEKNYRRTAQEWVEIFVCKGMDRNVAQEFVNAAYGSVGNFPAGRTCNAVQSLFKTFKPYIITNAVSVAVESKRISYQRIRALCERYEFANETNSCLNLWERRLIEDEEPLVHENIRNDYK